MLVGILGVRKYSDQNGNCTLSTDESWVGLFGFYLYSTCLLQLFMLCQEGSSVDTPAAFLWDIVILVFTVAGLRRRFHGNRSRIRSVLLTQAVIYVILNVALCIPMTVCRHGQYIVRFDS